MIYLLNNGRKTFPNFYGSRKPRIKYKLLQNAKERGGLELPDLKLYFEACCLVWTKVWVILKNRWLLELEGHELRFSWHSYLWYDKFKINIDFKNHFVARLSPKIPVRLSEPFFGREMMATQTWLSYTDLLSFIQREPTLKKRKQLEKEGNIYQYFTYAQLVQRFKLDKKSFCR